MHGFPLKGPSEAYRGGSEGAAGRPGSCGLWLALHMADRAERVWSMAAEGTARLAVRDTTSSRYPCMVSQCRRLCCCCCASTCCSRGWGREGGMWGGGCRFDSEIKEVEMGSRDGGMG